MFVASDATQTRVLDYQATLMELKEAVDMQNCRLKLMLLTRF